MIGKLSGTLSEKNPPQVLVDCHGVGYEVDVPMSTFYNLPAVGEQVSLLTHFVVREDAQILYGFGSPEERTAFRQLIKISGVGPRMALGVLSGMSVSELAQAITLQEAGRLVKIPGIGKKTAERLIVELKAKVGAGGAMSPLTAGGAGSDSGEAGSPHRDAVAALVALGYKSADADQAVRRAALALGGTASTETLIKKALN